MQQYIYHENFNVSDIRIIRVSYLVSHLQCWKMRTATSFDGGSSSYVIGTSIYQLYTSQYCGMYTRNLDFWAIQWVSVEISPVLNIQSNHHVHVFTISVLLSRAYM